MAVTVEYTDINPAAQDGEVLATLTLSEEVLSVGLINSYFGALELVQVDATTYSVVVVDSNALPDTLDLQVAGLDMHFFGFTGGSQIISYEGSFDANPDITDTQINEAVTTDVLDNDNGASDATVVSVSVDPAQGTAVINPDGTVTFTPAQDFLGDATVTYTIENTDGDTSTSTLTVTVSDTVAPTQTTTITDIIDDAEFNTGVIADGGVTNDTTPTLEGTISDALDSNEVVAVYRDGVKVGEATVTGNTWTFTDAGLSDGDHAYTARVEDSAGNQGDDSNEYNIVVDTVAPVESTVITTIVDDITPVVGNLSNGDTTNDTTPTLEGTVSVALEAGEEVIILRNGVEIGTATMTDATHWEFADSGLVDGTTYTYEARVEDAAGNRGAISNKYDITIDTSAPTQTVTIDKAVDDVAPYTGDLASGDVTNDSTPELQGHLDASLGTNEVVAIYRDGTYVGEATVNGTTWTFTDGGLANGEDYTYTARVEDAAGNQGATSNAFDLSIDTGGPSANASITTINDDVAPVVGAIANNGTTNDPTPTLEGTITGTLDAGDSVVVYRDGVAIGEATVSGTAWSFEDSGLVDGETYVYTVRVEDIAGNPGTTSSTYTISVDTSNPTQKVTIDTADDNVDPISGDIPDGGVTNDDTPEIIGHIDTALGAGESVVIYRNGVEIGTATTTGTTWSFTDSSLASGSTYEYTAYVKDAAGNTSDVSNSISFTVDTGGVNQTTQILHIHDDVDPVTGVIADNGTTNDTTPTLEGSINVLLEAGDKVIVYRDGVEIGEATVNGTSWTFEDTLASDGTYAYTALVENAAGTQGASSQEYTVTLDTIPPSATTTIDSYSDDVGAFQGDFGSGTDTDDTTPTLNGTITGALDTGDVVAIYRDGTYLGNATLNGNSWSYTDSGLVNGNDYTYTARVEDAAGNQGATSNAFDIGIDTNGPTVGTSITGVNDDVAPVTGDVANNGYTNDTTPELQGTITSALGLGEVVAVYRDGVKVGEATVSGTTWSYTDGGLVDGEDYTYTARVEDSAGNPGGDSNSYTINVDTSAPTQTTTITDIIDDAEFNTGVIADGGVTNDTTPTLEGTISDALDSNEVVAVYRDGVKVGEATVTGNTWTFTDAGLSDGDHAYTARVEDSAGNQGDDSNEYNIVVDTVAPVESTVITTIVDDITPVVGNLSNGDTTNDTTPTLEGTVSVALEAGEEVIILRNGVEIGTATMTDATHWEFADSGLVDGTTYTYEARVEDAAGNRGAISNKYDITIDTSAPTQTVTIDKAVDDVAPYTGDLASGDVTNDSTPELQGHLDASLGTNEVVAIYRDGTYVGEATVNGTTWTFTDGGLANGEDYTYTARVEDAAGNQGATSNAFDLSIDTGGPSANASITTINDDVAPVVGAIANNGTTNDPTPTLEGTITGTLDAGDSVVVYRDGVAIGEATVSGTAWSFEDSGLVDGETYVYTVRVEDIAGNPGTTSSTYTISVDTSNPTQKVTIDTADDNVDPISGDIPDGGVTNDDTPEIIGHIDTALGAGESVVIYRNGVEIGTATTTGTTWSFTDSSLASGSTYEYTAYVKDAAGNTSDVSNSISFTVDTGGVNQTTQILHIHDDVDPVTGVIADNGTTNDTTPTLEGSINVLLEAGDKVIVYRDGVEIGEATVNGTSWTFEDTLASDGTYAYTALVENAAGTQGASSQEYTVTLDTIPPSATTTIDSYSDDVGAFQGDFGSGTDTDDTTPTLNGTITGALDTGDVVAIYRDGTYLGNATVNGNSWSYTDSGLVNGNDYTYTARVEDAAGNQGATSNAFDIGIDTTLPATNSIDITYITEDTGVSDTDFITYDQTLVIGGTLANALQSDESVQVSLDGGTTWVDAVVSGTAWSYDNTGTTLAEGDYDTQVRIVDVAGNVGATDTQTVTVDITPPATNSIDITYISDDTGTVGDFITYDQTLVIGGTLANALQSSELVQISLDGGATWVDAVASGTTWSYDNTGSALSLGEYDVEARIIDVAGNIGADDAQKVTVINQNHAPTDLVTSVNNIDEYAKAGTVAATMYVIDPDLPNDSHTYALSGANADKFVIDADGTITVKNDGSLYLGCEANGEDQIVTVTVTVTDAGGLTYSEDVAINITNIMEAPIKYCNPCSHQDLHIVGADNNDVIVTGFGDDTVMGCAGNDYIQTGHGDDTIYAGAGNDKINAGSGNDTIYTGLGADYVYGNCGYDTVSYEHSSSAVTIELNGHIGSGGDAEGDTLWSVEHLIGSDYDDVLIESCGADLIEGGKGNDTIYLDYSDTGFGGEGNDTFIIDSGYTDGIHGGEGYDTIQFGSTSYSDMTNYHAPDVSSIEMVDMTDGSWYGDKLTLDKDAVESMTDNDLLYVQGDSNDKVFLEGEGSYYNSIDWTQAGQDTVNGVTYNVYTLDGQTVMVDADVSVVLH